MHRSESAWETDFALHDDAEQEKSTYAESPGEKEIQSVFTEAHSAPGNEVIIYATENSKTSFRISSCQPSHAAAPDRYRHGGNRLQKPGSSEKICNGERQNSASSSYGNARLHAPENNARDQAQSFGAVDEVGVECSPRRASAISRSALRLWSAFAFLNQLPELASLTQLRIF